MLLWYLVPVWDRFATMVVIGIWGRHGATHDLAQWGVSWSARECVVAMEGFCWNVVGPPEWECEAMGSLVWVQCATSADCIQSINSRVHGYGHVRK